MSENNKNTSPDSQMSKRLLRRKRLTFILISLALIIGMFTLSFALAYNKLTAGRNNAGSGNLVSNDTSANSELAEENRQLRETIALLTAQTEELQAKINSLSSTSSNENSQRPSVTASATPKATPTPTPKTSTKPTATPTPSQSASPTASPSPAVATPSVSPVATPNTSTLPIQTVSPSLAPLPKNDNTRLPALPPNSD